MDKAFSLRNLAGLDTYTIDKPITVLGRKSDCDLVIASEESSRNHATLTLEDGQLVLEDLGSTNGTYVNEVKIRSATQVKSGDIIGIGGQKFRVLAPGSSGNTTIFGTRVVDDSSFVVEKDSPDATGVRQRFVMPPGWKSNEGEGVSGANSRLEQELDQRLQSRDISADTHLAALMTVDGSGKQALYLLPRGVANEQWLVGRSDECDITIEDATVSSKHASLACDEGKWVVRDNKSTNGVKINGSRRQRAVIKSGDRVSFGEIELLFRVL